MQKAQSMLEYVLILTVIMLALLAAGRQNGPLQGGMNNYFNAMEEAFENAAEDF